MTNKTTLFILTSNAVFSAMIGFVVYLYVSKESTQAELISEFYAVENAVYVSPHSLRKSMDSGELPYTLIDLRSAQEYEKEHIVGAMNIPAYSNPDTSAYDDIDRIVQAFKDLPKGKDIVVYCYSMPCMTGRKIGNLLVKQGIYVKHLGIGWNEWRHFWNLWNHEHEWDQTNVLDYVVEGKDSGIPMKKEQDTITPCSLDDTFGC